MTNGVHERAAWERHPNIGGPPSTLLAIHDQFRAASRRLAFLIDRAPLENIRGLRRAFEPLATTLHHHHHAEEVMLFPMVLERTGSAPEQLVSDHQVLKSAIAAVEAALSEGDKTKAKATIASFDEILVAHLGREEALVIPVLLEMTASEGWALLHG
ncbi:MAG: hemerythrin domain-containing protein [Polyangiaceae bacterium]